MIIKIIFWSAIGFIAYTYLFFPLMTLLRSIFWRIPIQQAKITPHVSLIIAAYNEAQSIAAKIDNSLALDYPREKLEIIIASDGSTDGTDEIVRSYANQGIRLLSLARRGKAPTLNAAVDTANGEILVFSDANSMYAPDAILSLVRPFADAQVGGVAGNQIYLKDEHNQTTSAGENGYWNFDRKLKKLQCEAGNTISATGAIYAIRRSLFQPIPNGVTDDFMISTGVIAQGSRLVFASDAVAYEPATKSSTREFGRKVRIMTRGLRAVLMRRELLNPFRYGYYAIQLLSHKILRRLVVFPLVVLLLLSPWLWSNGPLYQILILAQLIFYSCGALGMILRNTNLGKQRGFTVPFFFCMVNIAALIAVINILRGYQINLWEPQREESNKEQIPSQIVSR